jgi:hypothetical protein
MAFFPVSSGIGGAVIAAPDSIPRYRTIDLFKWRNDLNDVLKQS